MDGAVAPRADRGNQRVAVGARDRVLARGIDLGDGNHIGPVETGGKVWKQPVQPGEPVGLMHGDHARAVHHGLPRGPDDRRYFHRVMAVIVDHRHAADLAHAGKPAADPLESRQGGPDPGVRHSQLKTNCNGGQGVGNIVIPGHGQGQVNDGPTFIFPAQAHIESGLAILIGQTFGPQVGLGIEPESHHAARGAAFGQRRHFRVVGAQNRQPVERHGVDEAVKAGAQGVKATPMLQMLGVDIGDNGDLRRQQVE